MPFTGGDAARMLAMLQRLLEIPGANLQSALTQAANVIADTLGADKVDAFLYDERRDSLVALGTSTQPLSILERSLGLDVLPVSNGGRVVQVYQTGEPFCTGRLLDDAQELRGIKEGLRTQSVVAIPLTIGPRRRGALVIAALEPDRFSDADASFAQSAARWVALVAHRAELVGDIERNAVEAGRRAAAEELVTVLAHDLRHYLSPISNRLHILRRRAQAAGDEAGVMHVDAALSGVAGLSGLITNLLDVSRLDRGLLALDVEPVDLEELAREAALALSDVEHEIVVRAAQAVVVGADRARLRQCVDNLLANALTYSPRGAPVNVLISRAQLERRGWGEVEVVDEGPGMPQEVLARIFDRFYSARTSQGGVGLGLYLAREIALAHGGDLVAHSSPGKGARFVLRIPLFGEDDALGEAPAAAPGQTP